MQVTEKEDQYSLQHLFINNELATEEKRKESEGEAEKS